MRQKPFIYVAGPYRIPNIVLNVRNAALAAAEIRRFGAVPIVPHYFSYVEDLVSGNMDDDQWIEATKDQLVGCDAMYRLPGFSTGTDGEETLAVESSIPVFYDLDSLTEWIITWKSQVVSM